MFKKLVVSARAQLPPAKAPAATEMGSGGQARDADERRLVTVIFGTFSKTRGDEVDARYDPQREKIRVRLQHRYGSRPIGMMLSDPTT
jgi:hypothetical protein